MSLGSSTPSATPIPSSEPLPRGYASGTADRVFTLINSSPLGADNLPALLRGTRKDIQCGGDSADVTGHTVAHGSEL